MDSPQSVVSPFKGSSPVFAHPENHKSDLFPENPGYFSQKIEVQSKESAIGVLEVYIHQARDIHNICIYHKQDVYAKICLTSDPENTVSTHTINGGGQNPVFNEKLQLNVRTIDTSLKCEIWMLSRVRNYLEDQLLGFSLVPLSEILIKNGELEKEFTLSSTDLFHSPAGFVQLSLSYNGTSPEVIAVAESTIQDSEVIDSIQSDFEKIEFPDPEIANENDRMVSEYIGIQCPNLDSQSSDSVVTSDLDNQVSSEISANPVESFSANGSPSDSNPASSQSCETELASKSPSHESISPLRENPKEKRDVGDSESNVSEEFAKPVVTVNIPEQKVVQQEIVDMYMKSMQQFTESLAKMKLPMDIESGPTSSESSTSDQKLQATKNTGSRVFYGSRAFF